MNRKKNIFDIYDVNKNIDNLNIENIITDNPNIKKIFTNNNIKKVDINNMLEQVKKYKNYAEYIKNIALNDDKDKINDFFLNYRDLFENINLFNDILNNNIIDDTYKKYYDNIYKILIRYQIFNKNDIINK